MNIITWNVNSLKVRLPQLIDLLQSRQPDIIVLQELKLEQEQFPAAAIELAGYRAVWSGQKTYNGVAILAKHGISDVRAGLPALPDDPQRRVLAATVAGVRVVCVYCVNGESLDSPKFIYKQQWFEALNQLMREEIAAHGNIVLLGDFNIAPADADCYAPEKWHEKIHCSTIERRWFQSLLDLGLTDSLRFLHPDDVMYTWWDYRGAMFQRKQGLRIDHILVGEAMKNRLTAAGVDTGMRGLERPSDHAPVWAEFADI